MSDDRKMPIEKYGVMGEGGSFANKLDQDLGFSLAGFVSPGFPRWVWFGLVSIRLSEAAIRRERQGD